MSYQVLARKYRPQKFTEVIAQEHVTTTLANAITSGRVSSGYLFCGPRGTGKTSVARILARSINCVEGPTINPCGECDSCVSIGTEASIDVREIDAASNTSVDDVRALKENINYGPTSAKRRRIYIIDEVHRLSGPAFDALLKTLEEPPAHAMFIFATTEPQKVPDTIHSRTQRFDFHRVSTGDLIEPLGKMAQAEGFEVSEGALRVIARRGDGSVRDSISLLDQMISFSDGAVTEEMVVKALGLVERSFYFEFVEALAGGDASRALQMIADLSDQGADLKDFTVELSEHFRRLTILKSMVLKTMVLKTIAKSTGPSEAERILDLTTEECEQFNKQIEFYTIGDLVRLAEILSGALNSMRDLEPRWTLEIAALKMAHLESTIRIEEALAGLDSSVDTAVDSTVGTSGAAPAGQSPAADLFNGQKKKLHETRSFSPPTLTQSPTLTPSQTPTPRSTLTIKKTEPKPALVASASSSASQKPASQVIASDGVHINLPKAVSGWPDFLNQMKNKSRMLASQLSMARVRDVKSNRLHVRFPHSGEANKALLERPMYRSQVESALKEFFGASLSISFELDEPVAGAVSTTKAAGAMAPGRSSGEALEANQLLEKDEKLRQLVERIEGDIIEVTEARES